jgi:hypothetical protein
MFCLSVFYIETHEFIDLKFRVLPHFKITDILLGLPVLKNMNVIIHPSLDNFTMGYCTVHHSSESHGISCMIVVSDKLNQKITKQARYKKKKPNNISLISLHCVKELASVKKDFGNSSICNLNILLQGLLE